MNRLRGVARRDLPFLLLAWAIKSLLPGCQSALCVFSHVFRPSFLKNRKSVQIYNLLVEFFEGTECCRDEAFTP